MVLESESDIECRLSSVDKEFKLAEPRNPREGGVTLVYMSIDCLHAHIQEGKSRHKDTLQDI